MEEPGACSWTARGGTPWPAAPTAPVGRTRWAEVREIVQDLCCEFTEEVEVAYNKGLGEAVVTLGEAVHGLDSRS